MLPGEALMGSFVKPLRCVYVYVNKGVMSYQGFGVMAHWL